MGGLRKHPKFITFSCPATINLGGLHQKCFGITPAVLSNLELSPAKLRVELVDGGECGVSSLPSWDLRV